MKARALFLVLGALTSGCAYTTAVPVGYADTKTEGIRVYDPQLLLFVTCTTTQVLSVPDMQRGYALQAKAYLAKNEAKFIVQEGQLTQSETKLDTTGLLSLLQAWGEKALDQVEKLGALGASVAGGIPGMEGVWLLRLNADGGVDEFRRVAVGTPCAPAAPPPAAKAGAIDGSKAPKKEP